MKNKYFNFFWIVGRPFILLFGCIFFCVSCSNNKDTAATKTTLQFRGAGADPAYLPGKGFRSTPLEFYGKRNRIAVFRYTQLYDSSVLKIYESPDDAYCAHLIQYANEHPDLRFVSSETCFSPDGVVIGHTTYWEIPFEVTIPQNPKRSASAASEDIMINEKMIPPPVKVPNLLKIQTPRPKKTKI